MGFLTSALALSHSGAFAVPVANFNAKSPRTLQRNRRSEDPTACRLNRNSRGFAVMCSTAFCLLSAGWRRGCVSRRFARSQRSGSPPTVAVVALQPPMKLIIVDGSYYMFRAYFAARFELNNSNGEPVAALNTFLQSVLILETAIMDPTHVIIAMDCARSLLLRRAEFPEYKAQRPACPDDLRSQFGKAAEACKAFGWQCRSMVGHEADDLIHTYTEAALNSSPDSTVHVFSSDKDLLQLVRPRVWVHRDPSNPGVAMDEASVQARMQVKPCQIADFLALVGDSSDNIPGVPTIGSKRAATLLQRHQTLHGVLEAAKDGTAIGSGITAKIMQSLVDHGERALKMRELVTLRSVDVPDVHTLDSDCRLPEKNDEWLETALQYCHKESLPALATQLINRFGLKSPHLNR
mmetsp:Transcript_52457/g.148568  ORF Transcript_52457/g.148568 Transcript_52457/m.148568 type:complete len:407 (+) Transcript_52457:45-1265(+)